MGDNLYVYGGQRSPSLKSKAMRTKTKATIEKYKVGTTHRYYDGNELMESKVKEVRVVGDTITVLLDNFYQFDLICY